MKFCKWCQTEKPIEEFYKHSRMADGHLNKCKTCCYEWTMQYRQTPAGKATRAKEKQYPESKKKYKKSEKGREAEKKHKLQPDRQAAKGAVAYAIRTGKLIRLPCEVCGDPKSHGHHWSYAKEHRLDVKWLCPTHHNEEHRRLDGKTSWKSMTY